MRTLGCWAMPAHRRVRPKHAKGARPDAIASPRRLAGARGHRRLYLAAAPASKRYLRRERAVSAPNPTATTSAVSAPVIQRSSKLNSMVKGSV